jgi:hypothetical protein
MFIRGERRKVVYQSVTDIERDDVSWQWLWRQGTYIISLFIPWMRGRSSRMVF